MGGWPRHRGAGGRGRGAVRGTRQGRGAVVGGPEAQPSGWGLPSGVVPGQLGVWA